MLAELSFIQAVAADHTLMVEALLQQEDLVEEEAEFLTSLEMTLQTIQQDTV
jgi:hypothetical protein